MAPQRPHYLVRRGDTFYFRRAFPGNLINRFSRNEIKVSLRTDSPRLARMRCRDLSNRFEHFIELVWAMPELTPQVIDSLLKNYFLQELTKFNDILDIAVGDDTSGFVIDEELPYVETKLPELRKNLAARKYPRDVLADADGTLAHAGFNASKATTDQLAAVRHGVMRAKVELYRIYAALMRGEYDDTNPKDPLFMSSVSAVIGQSTSMSQGEELGEIVRRFITFKGTLADKTLGEYRRVMDWFMEMTGKTLPITAISKDHVGEFRDAVMALPKNYIKFKEFSGLSFTEVIKAGKDYEKIAGKTANKYLIDLKTFLKWCVDEEYIASVPGAKVNLPKSVIEDGTDRKPFDHDQLKTIFTSPVYTGRQSRTRRTKSGKLFLRDGHFWVPLIGLFSGMRLGEIVQLRTADIRQDGGACYFDVTTVEGDDGEFSVTELRKHLKSKQSQRRIPIHSELIAIGLLDYVSDKRKNNHGSNRLFPDIKPGKDGYYSHNFSKTFSRDLEAFGVKTKSHVFHSFRHNFKSAMDLGGVQDTHKDALMGHTDMNQAKNTYAPLYDNVAALVPDMDRVKYALDLSHLYKNTHK